ncbi:MAG: PTS sugar transporter subunit IIB [Enterococcus sp.]
MNKRIIVACGSGVATSQTIASKLTRLLEEDKVNAQVEAVDYKSIYRELPSTAIYIYIAQPDAAVLEKAKELGIHVFPGIPFLTGMGMEQVYQEIRTLID